MIWSSIQIAADTIWVCLNISVREAPQEETATVLTITLHGGQ